MAGSYILNMASTMANPNAQSIYAYKDSTGNDMGGSALTGTGAYGAVGLASGLTNDPAMVGMNQSIAQAMQGYQWGATPTAAQYNAMLQDPNMMYWTGKDSINNISQSYLPLTSDPGLSLNQAQNLSLDQGIAITGSSAKTNSSNALNNYGQPITAGLNYYGSDGSTTGGSTMTQAQINALPSWQTTANNFGTYVDAQYSGAQNPTPTATTTAASPATTPTQKASATPTASTQLPGTPTNYLQTSTQPIQLNYGVQGSSPMNATNSYAQMLQNVGLGQYANQAMSNNPSDIANMTTPFGYQMQSSINPMNASPYGPQETASMNYGSQGGQWSGWQPPAQQIMGDSNYSQMVGQSSPGQSQGGAMEGYSTS